MFKYIHEHIGVRLLLIDNNVYSFFGGILISLATNIFTTECFFEFDFFKQWHIYLAAFLFTVASATCVFVATKMADFQKYMKEWNIKDIEERKEIIKDITKTHIKLWVTAFMVLFIAFLAGILLLLRNFALLKS